LSCGWAMATTLPSKTRVDKSNLYIGSFLVR
jgi:hypothetical protein